MSGGGASSSGKALGFIVGLLVGAAVVLVLTRLPSTSSLLGSRGGDPLELDDDGGGTTEAPEAVATKAAASTPRPMDPPTVWKFNTDPVMDPKVPRSGYANAQYREDDAAAFTFFPNKRNGIIVESGALDGMLFSTSHLFVKEYGWKAVHVEASPVSAARLMANRPESINVHAALCSKETTLHYIGPSQHATSTAVGGIIEFMHDGALDFNFPKNPDGHRYGIYGGGRAVIDEIKCVRLDSILEKNGISHVDFWVLDVEGAEFPVLQTIDLQKVRIDVIAIEMNNDHVAIHNHLAAMGYYPYMRFPKQNTWFVRLDFPVRAFGSKPACPHGGVGGFIDDAKFKAEEFSYTCFKSAP